jgi:hypothetical protein
MKEVKIMKEERCLRNVFGIAKHHSDADHTIP